MSHWRDDYLASLQEAERNNPVNKDLVEACSQLADRVAALEAEKAAWATDSPALPTKAGPSKPPSTSTADPTASPEGAAQFRLDLAEALRGRGQAQARLKAAEAELTTLRSKNRVDTKRIGDLTAERNALTARVRDLNEELEKKKNFLKVCETGERDLFVCLWLCDLVCWAPTSVRVDCDTGYCTEIRHLDSQIRKPMAWCLLV
ncbi:autophagy protein 16-domain-containing protein [Xylaria digitata]|nr:autophagy protein 16-domain-containing protein [Xylaria digitata]